MLFDFASRQDIEALSAQLAQVLQHVATPAPQPAADDMLSVLEVAKYTGFSRTTVEKWIEEGDYNQHGKRVYLPAYKYSGRLRFKRSDVEAFGLGVGVLRPSLVAGQRPEPTKATRAKTPSTKPKKSAVASEDALRVAS